MSVSRSYQSLLSEGTIRRCAIQATLHDAFQHRSIAQVCICTQMLVSRPGGIVEASGRDERRHTKGVRDRRDSSDILIRVPSSTAQVLYVRIPIPRCPSVRMQTACSGRTQTATDPSQFVVLAWAMWAV